MPEELDFYQFRELSASAVASNFWNGLVQGWSTLPVGDKPRNDVEGIAHSLGHLVGFIGGVPGVGTITSLGVKTAVKGGQLLTKHVLKEGAKKAFAKKATKKVIKDAD